MQQKTSTIRHGGEDLTLAHAQDELLQLRAGQQLTERQERLVSLLCGAIHGFQQQAEEASQRVQNHERTIGLLRGQIADLERALNKTR